jgi:hypothetical protein
MKEMKPEYESATPQLPPLHIKKSGATSPQLRVSMRIEQQSARHVLPVLEKKGAEIHGTCLRLRLQPSQEIPCDNNQWYFFSSSKARSLLKQIGHSSKSTDGEQVRFETFAILRFGRFDIYVSNVDNEKNPPSYTVVTSVDQDTKGSSFVARLNYGRLGNT